MKRRTFLAGTSAVVFSASCAPAWAADKSQWGVLKGRFIYDAEPPEPKRFEVTKDAAFVKEPLNDESLLVDKNSRGLANVVVRLVAERDVKLPVHPTDDEARKKPVRAAIEGLAFQPHVIVVRTGQTLILSMPDRTGHNPHWHARHNREVARMINSSRTMTRVFNDPEAEPIPVFCTVHPWEGATLVVTDHPYVAVSQADGSFAINNVPVGTWDFQLWHERANWLTQITIGADRRGLDHGKLRVEIKPGENDLGEIKVAAKMFDK